MSIFKPSRTLSMLLALCAAVAVAQAEEIQGQKGMGGASRIMKAPNVSQAQLNGAGAQAANWLHTNGDYAQARFCPGKQLNTGNRNKLQPVSTSPT